MIRKRLKRREETGQTRYLTFSCYGRLPLLSNDAIKTLVVEQLERTRRRLGFDLLAWVIMPEHVHLIVLPDPPRLTVPTILSALKRPVSRRVLARWRQLNANILQRIADSRNDPHFWQAGGGYDRNVLVNGELREKIGYIHENPVRRGLADRAIDWPWSSARFHAGMTDEGPKIARELLV